MSGDDQHGALSDYAVMWGGKAYKVPAEAFCFGTKNSLFGHYLAVTGYENGTPMRMGEMLLGRDWPIIWHAGLGGSTQPGVFKPLDVRILKGKLRAGGPEVNVWYFVMRSVHPPTPWFSDRCILWRVPHNVVEKCWHFWHDLQDTDPLLEDLFRFSQFVHGKRNDTSIDPVLNGWELSEEHSTTVLTPWRRLRTYARFVGSLAAALRTWHEEVHHRPKYFCKKDENGETEAARAMEKEMSAPVFSEGRLG